MLTVQCPKCGQTLRLLERHLGVKGKCLKCAEPIIAERDDDGDEIEVLLLTQYRKRQAVVTPIESARAEWTPFELAANETGTFPVMNTNDPSPAPAVSPFGELDTGDSKAESEAKVNGSEEPKESGENKQPGTEAESKDAKPKSLGGFSSALFSKDGFPPVNKAAAEAETGTEAETNAAESADVEDAGKGQAEVSEDEPASSAVASRPKAAMPPLPGIAGMAGFPFPGKLENKTSEDKASEKSAESADGEVSGPQFSNAIDSGDAPGEEKSKALPWMEMLAGKADSESEDTATDDAAASVVTGGAEAVEAEQVAVPGQESDKAETDNKLNAESAASGDDGSAADDGVDGESRSKLNWAAGLKSKSNQMSGLGAIGVSAKPEDKIEVKPIKDAESKGAGDDAPAPPAATEPSAQADGKKQTGPDSSAPRDEDASSKADIVTSDADSKKTDNSEADAAEVPPAKTKSNSAIEGADPSVTSGPKVNKVRERRNRRKVRRLVAILLFLVIPAAGIASLMYFKPAFRPKQLQPALMAAFDEGKDQFADSEKAFDIQSIIAPITALWTRGPQPVAEESSDADVIAAEEVGAPGAPEVKPADTVVEKTLVAEVAAPVGNAASGSAPDGTEKDGDVADAVDVAVATSPESGPAADLDANVVGGASPADEVELTRAGPGENDETRRVRTEGEAILKQFYAARSAEGKLAYVLNPGSVAAAIEDAFPSPVEIPSIRSMAFKGRLVDSSTKRVFGVFDVRENENGDRHRWCVPEIAPDQFKVDWELYQQLAGDELTRFLATPGAQPETFRLLIRRGPLMAEAERPWNEETLEMHLLMPLDDGKPSRVLMTRSRHDELGFKSDLADGAARVGKVQLSWKESATEPGLKVPTISAIERWGAWE